MTTAEGATQRASEVRQRGAEAVAAAVQTLDAQLARLDALRCGPQNTRPTDS